MVPVPIDGSNQQSNVDASREIMQGLFQDLGKQAMALEAILRVVCGKVDRMESWMTTISFGMSELDLKLRNIAHNIDGTSAVDDNTSGSQPWTVPPPDDDVESAHAVATVSKKFGKNSKQIRVTGVAAAIIDKLAAEPKDASEKSNKKKKDSIAPVTATPKKAAKKKLHGPKRSHNASFETEVQSHVAPMPADRTNSASSSLASEPEKAIEDHHLQDASTTKPTASFSIDLHADEAPMVPASTTEAIKDDPPQVQETMSESGHIEGSSDEATAVSQDDAHEKVDPVYDNETPSPHLQESANPIPDTEKSSSHPSPREEHDDEMSSGNSSIENTPVNSSRTVGRHEIEGAHEIQTEIDESQTSTPSPSPSSSSVTGEAFEPDTVVSCREQAAPCHEKLVVEDENIEDLISDNQPTDAPTHSTAALSELDSSPTLHQRESVQVQADTETPALDIKASPICSSVESSPESIPSGSADRNETHSKEPSKRRRSSLLERVLAMKESALNHEEQTPTESVLPGKPLPLSTPTPCQPDERVKAELQLQEQQELQLEAPKLHSSRVSDDGSEKGERDAFGSGSDSDSGTSGDDDDNSSDSSSSSSSDDSVENVTEQEPKAQIKKSDSSATGKTPSVSKRASVATGSSISRTMIALKKLKKANMLTPEEEEELKHRAQDKWFKLKGHVKEKQKKEVANILLKRKKNVFTVSSRLELLEEKSRELFSSMKQIGNELKLKADVTAHESLRRQVADMQRSLQSLDIRLGRLASQNIQEKLAEFDKQISTLRLGISEEFANLHQAMDSQYTHVDAQITEQRDRLHTIEETIPQNLAMQAQAFEQKLHALPDFGPAIDSIRKTLRRKADLKLLKELEARLLGHTLEEEDCLVRCLSCHKEVINLPQLDKDGEDEETASGASSNVKQLRKVNPGPSSAKIYRSNVPFSAEPTGMNKDATTNSDGTVVPLETKNATTVTAVTRRLDASLPKASPISRLTIIANSTPPSPDRPISAPSTVVKNKSITTIRTRANTALQHPKE